MAHPASEDHGPSLVVANHEIGTVSKCTCGVVTVTLQYLSLRFEPAAFNELQHLLQAAQARIDREAGLETPLAHPPKDAQPMH